MTDDYGALVRLTCLLWAGPDDGGEHRLARAHRLARRALRRRPPRYLRPRYEDARGRVLWHVLRKEPQPRPARLTWRLQVEPAAPSEDAARLRDAIAKQYPSSRAAYLLTELDDKPDQEAIEEVFACGQRTIVDGPARVRSRLEEETGLPRDRQRELLTGPDFDPGRVRMSQRARPRDWLPRPTRRHLRGAGITAIVLFAAAFLSVVYLPEPDDREAKPPWEDVGTKPSDGVRIVSADRWRVNQPGFAVWPTSGNRRHDTELLQEAARTWYQRGRGAELEIVGAPRPRWWPGEMPDDTVQILFAGTLDATSVVLMRTRDLMARYQQPQAAEGDPTLIVQGLDSDGTVIDNAWSGQVIPLIASEESVRFLVPPWLTDLHVSSTKGDRPTWRPVTVRNGVTEPLPVADSCRDHLMFRGTHVNENNQPIAASLFVDTSYRPWQLFPLARLDVTPADAKDIYVDVAAPLDNPQTMREIRALLCDDVILDHGVAASYLGLREVWQGTLPNNGGPASLVHVRVNYMGRDRVLGSRISERALLVGSRPGDLNHSLIWENIASGDGIDGADDVGGEAMAGWWQADSGRWYYLVAGSPQVERIRLTGGIDRVVQDGFAAIRGPKDVEFKKLPDVTAKAVDTAGKPVDVAGG